MAVTNRLGSLSLITDTLRDVSAGQVRLADLQNQISSGFKSQDFEGLNGSVEQFIQVSSQIDRATQFQTNNTVNIAKLQTADVALSKIVDIADTMKNIIVGANGATIGTSNIPQTMRDLITAVAGQLNATFNGSYLFGGSDTINPPVPSPITNNSSPGLPDDNFYGGSKQDVTLRADDRTDITFPARADDIAFQKILAAANLAIEAANAKDTSTMLQAQQLIQSAQADLSQVRARVGSTVNNIETVDDRLRATSIYWKQLADDQSKTDIVAASTEVASHQAVLQATFQVYARLSQLRLADYLR